MCIVYPVAYDLLTTSTDNRLVVTPKTPYEAGSSGSLNPFSTLNPLAPRTSNNLSRAPADQPAAPFTVTQSPTVSNTGDTSSSALQPQNKDEAGANKAALAQLSKLVFGFDPVQKYDEVVGKLEFHQKTLADQEHLVHELITSGSAKDTRIATLERDIKKLQDELAASDDWVFAAAERANKRKKTA